MSKKRQQNHKGRSTNDILVFSVILCMLIYNVSVTVRVHQFSGGQPVNVRLSELDILNPIDVAKLEEKTNIEKAIVVNERAFPPGCSGKCYINNNPDIVRSFKWSENALIMHYHKKGKLEGKKCYCQIAIFAGPHDASTLSMQKIANTYSDLKAIPWERAQMKKIGEDVDRQALQLAFKKDAESKLNEQAMNMIVGPKDISRMSKSVFGKVKLDSELENAASELMSFMPQSAVETGRAIVYLNYQSPRIDSLTRLWVQEYHKSKTFYEFLMSDDLNLLFNKIDIIPFARKLLKKGFRVKIINMSGISKEYPTFVGCELMGLQCSIGNDQEVMLPNALINKKFGYTIMERITKETEVEMPTRFENMNVTSHHLIGIDYVLKLYDCASLEKLTNDYSVEILHEADLMSECKRIGEKELLTRKALLGEIRGAFQNELGDLIDNILDGKI